VTLDQINAIFEFSASFFVVLSIRQILIDKAVAGVSWLGCLFFPVWSFWGIFYYTSLAQMWSFMATCLMAYAETTYFILLVYYGGIGLGKKVKNDTR
jgi:hypothetical protein